MAVGDITRPDDCAGDVQRDAGSSFAPGAELGAYRIVRELGRGGMGTVYHAEHARLGRPVAIKVLARSYAVYAEVVQRFFAEARGVNQIRHENIVEITDFVEVPEACLYYYVMELLEGEELEALLARERGLDETRAARIGAQVASALESAHSVGIVHRDIKPANIFLIDRSGRSDFVKVLDFGVAKLLQGGQEDPSPDHNVTAPGIVLGTPAYMSPEQASARPIDGRSDIYSLGVVLFEMITGRQPFEGADLGQLMVQHITAAPPRPSDLLPPDRQPSAAFESLVMQCLEKAPDDRPGSMAEVRADLEAIAAGQVPAPRTVVQRAHPGPRRRLPLVLAGLAAVALVGGVVALALAWPRAEPAQPTGPAPAARPESVALRFTSTPAGVEVVDDSGAVLGVTPFELTLERAETPLRVELRKQGFRSETREVPRTASSLVVISLAALEPAPEPVDADLVAASLEGGVLPAQPETAPTGQPAQNHHDRRRDRPDGGPASTPGLDRGAVLDPYGE